MNEVKEWFVKLSELGPAYGYFPKPSKTVVVVKNSTDLSRAEDLFTPLGVKVTLAGERHLGAAIGSQAFRESYVKAKVECWTQDIVNLAEIAKEDPQVAYCAYVKGIAHRWSFLQRTIADISHLFVPLEDSIRTTLIPALIGRSVSDVERKILALPVRYGGLALVDPVSCSDREYSSSKFICQPLISLITAQQDDLNLLDETEMKRRKNLLKKEKEDRYKQESAELATLLGGTQKRAFELSQEKGASNWLSCLPLKSLGYCLNKQEFIDAIALRYGWPVRNVPKFCSCGKPSDIDHLLLCPLGGYTHLRHNSIRDTFAKLLSMFCKDVQTEPALLPTTATLATGTVTGEAARLDVSARGIFSPLEKTFLDIRVTHPNAPYQRNKSIATIYKDHEKQKRTAYSDRVTNVEKASFIPVVMSTFGGYAPEAEHLVKRMGCMIAKKRGEHYADVVRHIRSKIRFAMLRACLISVRGFRGRAKVSAVTEAEEEVDFGLIPTCSTFEPL